MAATEVAEAHRRRSMRVLSPGTLVVHRVLRGSGARPLEVILERLRGALSPRARVTASGFELELYATDQADVPPALSFLLPRTSPDVVVQPASSDDVAAAVRVAVEFRLPIIPRGAASFPLGGTVPVLGGLVVDLSALRGIIEVDRAQQTVEVEAGVKWFQLQEHLRAEGLALRTYPTSFFSTVAGWAATGGLGINSLRYGHLRDNVVALQIVTPQGELRWVRSDEPEFRRYFGTEGQLGIITRVRLKVRPLPRSAHPHLVQLSDSHSAFELAKLLLGDGPQPAHILYYAPHRMRTFSELAERVRFEERHSLLVVFEDGVGETKLEALLSRFQGAVLAPCHHAAYLWQERFFPLKPKRLGPGLLGTELVLPLGRAALCLERWTSHARYSGVELEGESHILGPDQALVLGTFKADPRRRLSYLLRSLLVVELTEMGIRQGGVPYGTGIWNTPFLEDRFGKAGARELRRLKQMEDPQGLLNPGKFFGVRSRFLNLLGIALSPKLAKLAIQAMSQLTPPLAMLLSPYEGLPRGDVVNRSAMECSRCGACVPVCPAYLATGSELVTGRGKLQLMARSRAGKATGVEDAQAMFLCIHCGACEEVCQSQLPLLRAYETLEAEIAARHGVPHERIRAFAAQVQASEEYRRLLGLGMVPKAFYTFGEPKPPEAR